VADFGYNYQVCSCNNVTLGEIVYAIEYKGAKTIEEIGKITDAGTTCGCCKSKKYDFREPKMKLYIDQILEKLL
jgi:NAD(P)H-nitrite reductase large subunit